MLLNEAPLGAEDTSPGREPGVATRFGSKPREGAAEVVITSDAFFCPDGAIPQRKRSPGSRSVLLACRAYDASVGDNSDQNDL